MNAKHNVSWDDEGGNHDEVEPVDTICALIRSLNGLSRSCVTAFDGSQTIGVGGGGNGEVVVYRTEDGMTFYNLIGDQEADGTTEVFVCGQPGEFSTRTLVSIRVAALAVSELLSGKPSSFVWDDRLAEPSYSRCARLPREDPDLSFASNIITSIHFGPLSPRLPTSSPG